MSKYRIDFKSMPTDELLVLFEDLAATLTDRIAAEKTELNDRLRQLHGAMAVVEHADETASQRQYH